MVTLRLHTYAHSGLIKDLYFADMIRLQKHAGVIYIDDRLVRGHPDLVACPCCHYCGESMDPKVRGSRCGVCTYIMSQGSERNPATRESEGWTSAFAKLLYPPKAERPDWSLCVCPRLCVACIVRVERITK